MRRVGGLKVTMALAVVAFGALMLAPAVMGSSGGMGGATPAQTLNSSYFPDGYVNQATTIEPVVATF